MIFTDSAPFWLKEFSQNTGVVNHTNKGSGQDGNTFLSNSLDDSDISLKISVRGSEKSEFDQLKSKLRRVFNPKFGMGSLIHNNGEKDLEIKCVPAKVPFIVNKSDRRGECIISLIANNPYWMDMNQTKEEIALWVGDFEFDILNGLQIPEDGIIMGHREPSLIVNCPNDGDGEAGMIIEFRALATLTNPSLRNVNTQEFVKINKTMVAGEIIRVNTHFAEEDVEMELNGVTSNAFNYIDEDMTFLKLYQGDNLFRYDAETGLDNLVVNIYRQNKYLGV
nr:phage tail family protein [Acetobacterium sp. MES1]